MCVCLTEPVDAWWFVCADVLTACLRSLLAQWDDVKDDEKHRENYIGHSVMASKGRWQRGKDLNWYANGRSNVATDEQLREEKRVAREAEEDMMRKRLGLPPLKRQAVATGVRLDERERKDLLKRGGAGMGAESAEAEAAEKGEQLYGTERIGGLGSFKPARHGEETGPISSRIAPEDRLEGTAAAASSSGGGAGGGGGASSCALGGDWQRASAGGAAAHGSRSDRAEDAAGEARAERHRERKEHKHKKHKKEHKHKRDKEHKHKSRDKERKRRHDSSDEGSGAEDAAAPAQANKRQRHDSDSD